MYEQLTLLDIVRFTSSPVLAAGASPPDLLGSLTTSPCGQAPHPVSHSPAPASSAEQTTSGIYGQSCAASSLSAALQSSLASRLRADLASTGSPLYALTWKERAMRSGPPICALRASARRTCANGSTGEASGWPTPIVNDETGSQYCRSNGQQYLKVPGAAALTGWPTVNGPARITANGEILIGSSAEINDGARLDPAHTRWLMGYPQEWDDCAAMVTPLSRRSRRRS